MLHCLSIYKMKTHLLASAITTAIALYILKGQDNQTKLGTSVAVGLGIYYAIGQTPEESKTIKHVGIDPRTNCNYEDVEHSGETYACVI